jgi:hypothetical protein
LKQKKGWEEKIWDNGTIDTHGEDGIVLFGGISGRWLDRFGLASKNTCCRLCVLFRFVSICSVRMAGGIAQPLFFLQLVSLLLLYPPQPVPPAPFFLVYAVYPPFFVMLVLPSCYHFIESELRMFWIDTTCYVQLPFSTFYRYITLL